MFMILHVIFLSTNPISKLNSSITKSNNTDFIPHDSNYFINDVNKRNSQSDFESDSKMFDLFFFSFAEFLLSTTYFT